MTDLIERATRRRTKAPQCDVVTLRPGRFVTSYGGFTDYYDTEPMLIGPVHRHSGTGKMFMVGDWLLGTAATDEPAVEVLDPAEDAEARLRDICSLSLDTWMKVGAHQSSMRRAGSHPIFEIIRLMKPVAVDMIVERLRQEPNPLWIWALGELTGEDPARGTTTIPDAAEAWLMWGRARDIV
jgi:hypothetical protein